MIKLRNCQICAKSIPARFIGENIRIFTCSYACQEIKIKNATCSDLGNPVQRERLFSVLEFHKLNEEKEDTSANSGWDECGVLI